VAPAATTPLAPAFEKIDHMALGIAVGLVAGMGLWVATMVLVVKGGPRVGPHLALLAQYLPGYRVSAMGSIVGLAYGIAGGFLAGWTFAVLRNTTALVLLAVVRRRVERQALGRLLDYI
jgi:hypothetical protein